ncbi:hypothetical protein DD594_26005 [Enterobacter cloacae complex sp. 4DZ1-17B1]|uniref:hypothetical protein n=1 Tax=Enterobacter cloacae complex sp. 4DZ1-17B1 TaxID=2511991 RepID=UPI0010119170|nr:hypothetical protein DD594_26005 [Enterobacter cloacae complex sp. 4DZ1-17B1]
MTPEIILDHDMTTTRRGNQYRRYLVKYKNHSLEECQWISKQSLSPYYHHSILAYHTPRDTDSTI